MSTLDLEPHVSPVPHVQYASVSAQPTSSTSSSVPVTTTSTSLPPTTVSTTTTTRPPPTTTATTAHPTTTLAPTTTTAPVHQTSSSTPWGLVALVAGLALAIILLIVLLVARRSRARAATWRRSVVPALSDARLARDSLLSGNAESEDERLRAAVGLQVERAATAIEGTLPRAPEPEDANVARSVATSLRGLAFAIEADRLLRHGATAPSGAQLAEADQARRDRAAELDRAIARLSARIGRGQKHPPG